MIRDGQFRKASGSDTGGVRTAPPRFASDESPQHCGARCAKRHDASAGLTAPGAALSLASVDDAAAWDAFGRAVDEALWRYAEAVFGCRRACLEGGPSLNGRRLWLARLAAVRRLSAAADELDQAAAHAALDHGATYPALAAAAGMARQSAWKHYRRPGPAAGGGAT